LKTEQVDPNISNFIKSLRDVGYSYEIAVADIIDNSITATATKIKIYTVPNPEISFSMLDNGTGDCMFKK
jgi:DNA mismatch repair ATPase MutL